MSDAFEQQEWVKFGVAAALSRQYAQDQRSLLPMLATMLQSALPNETQVSHRGGLFSKKTVSGVTLTVGENRYTMEDPGSGPLRALRVRVVRGIALKTEEIPVDEWVAEIGAAIDEGAKRSASAREALKRLLG